MRFGGYQGLSLQDFPGYPAMVLFTPGCNLQCSYCHNPDLVRCRLPNCEPRVRAMLEARAGKVPGVVVTGGEPTLQTDLAEWLSWCRNLGYKIKLDSNGTRPRILAQLIEQGLIDYLALDYKLPDFDMAAFGWSTPAALAQSRQLLSQLSGELRTTISEPWHNGTVLDTMASALRDHCVTWWWQGVQTETVLDDQVTHHPVASQQVRQWQQRLNQQGYDIHLRGW